MNGPLDCSPLKCSGLNRTVAARDELVKARQAASKAIPTPDRTDFRLSLQNDSDVRRVLILNFPLPIHELGHKQKITTKNELFDLFAAG